MKALVIILGVISAIAASATALAFVGLPYRPLGVEFLQNSPYAAPVISAEANGSTDPTQIPDAEITDIVINGDFKILMGAGTSTTLGDGLDEITVWDFDFSEDPQFDDFPTSAPLESAILTLTVTPKSMRAVSDIVRISGLPEINPEEYEDLPQDEASTVQLELLDSYDSEDILERLTSENGRITMVSGDDHIVSSAELVLVSQSPINNGN